MSAVLREARAAIQPPELPRETGTFSFSAEKDWQQFISGLADFRFRESHQRDWRGPFVGCGDCLDPFSQHGDLCWIDPTLEPQDGDFVVIEWGPRALASEQFQRAAKDWRERYGREPGPLATKRLRKFGSSWVLAVRNSMYWLDDCRVLGVMVAKERGGVALHAPRACAIGPDAASDPIVVSSPADGNISYTSGTQPRIEASGMNASVSYTALANGGGVKAVIGWSAQATINNTTSGAAVGEARLSIAVTINSVLVDSRFISLETNTSSYGLFAGSSSYDVPGGQNITVTMAVGRHFSTGGASPAQTITWRAASLSLTPLKR